MTPGAPQMSIIAETEVEPEPPAEESRLASIWTRLIGPEEWVVTPEEWELGPGPYPGLRRPFRTFWWLIQILLGIAFLLPLLAALAAIPGLSLVSLGMMLDAEGRVGRSGRFRDGFPLLAVSTRVAMISLIVGLFLGGIFFASSIAEGQQIVGRISNLPQNSWSIGTALLQVVAFVILLLGIANGGSFGRFFWPLRRSPSRRAKIILTGIGVVAFLLATAQPGFILVYLVILMTGAAIRNARDLYDGLRSGEYVTAVNHWTEKLMDLFQPWHHLKIAVKGAIGALIWLAIPTFLLGRASTAPHTAPAGPTIASLIGGALMIPVAAWLPLLQCHQAATGEFRAIFDVRTVREIISRVPFRWAIATILLYGLAIPLYLSKVVFTPQDAFWFFTPLFILVIYPTRILMGWVYNSGYTKERRSSMLLRLPVKWFMIPVLGFYSLILFVLPLVSPAGPRAMYENHAFLLPVPSEQSGEN